MLALAVLHGEELLSSDRLATPVTGFVCPVRDFDTVASISPRVTRYPHDTPELTNDTVPVFLAWHFEFSEQATPPETEFLLEDPDRLQATDLGRSPLPFHRIRFANSKNGPRSPGDGRHLAYWDGLALRLKERAGTDENSFVGFENHLGEVWNVAWRGGAWIVAGAGGGRTQDFNLDSVLRRAGDRLVKAPAAAPPRSAAWRFRSRAR